MGEDASLGSIQVFTESLPGRGTSWEVLLGWGRVEEVGGSHSDLTP